MKQGDVFVSSWGYEQTNVDFYEGDGEDRNADSY